MKFKRIFTLLLILPFVGGCVGKSDLYYLVEQNMEIFTNYYYNHHRVYDDAIGGNPITGKFKIPLNDKRYFEYVWALWLTNKQYTYLNDIVIAECENKEKAIEYKNFLNNKINGLYVQEDNLVYCDAGPAYLLKYGEPLEKDGYLYYELDNGDTLLFGDICNCSSEQKGTNTTTTIPEWVDIIGGSMYVAAYSVHNPNADTLIIPKNVKEIKPSAFGCTQYKKIVLSEGLEKIRTMAFDGLVNLEYTIIPKSVRFIGDHAFNYGNIFCEVYQKPIGWSSVFATDQAKVYYADEWYYDENGVPQIK